MPITVYQNRHFGFVGPFHSGRNRRPSFLFRPVLSRWAHTTAYSDPFWKKKHKKTARLKKKFLHFFLRWWQKKVPHCGKTRNRVETKTATGDDRALTQRELSRCVLQHTEPKHGTGFVPVIAPRTTATSIFAYKYNGLFPIRQSIWCFSGVFLWLYSHCNRNWIVHFCHWIMSIRIFKAKTFFNLYMIWFLLLFFYCIVGILFSSPYFGLPYGTNSSFFLVRLYVDVERGYLEQNMDKITIFFVSNLVVGIYSRWIYTVIPCCWTQASFYTSTIRTK